MIEFIYYKEVVFLKKFEGMLFCTDLDGTLFDSNKAVSKENLDAIEYFKSEGGLFTFVTGREPSTTGEIYSLVKPNAPFGCLNGAGIYDMPNNRYTFSMKLPQDFIELVRCVDKEMPDMGIQLNTEKHIYFNKDNAAMVFFRKITGVPNLYCHYNDVKEAVLKVVFAHMEPAQIEALERLLKSHPLAENFDFIRSELRLFEILPKGASKGFLLEKLAEQLGIERHKTVAVGDYNNDVSMIKAAGIGFAVDNAVPEAKAVADYITVSNNDSAIAVIIEGLDKGIFSCDK